MSKTHQMSKTRFYGIWYDMKRRCTKDYVLSYKFYGERGVTFDPRWEDFTIFMEDMLDGYSDDLTLDRKDPTLGYFKDNCHWVPFKEQSKNKQLYRNNELGIAGMHIFDNKGVPNLKVRLCTDDGRKSKTFSLRKYSLNEAIELATNWRESMKKQYGYSKEHGIEAKTS